MGKGYDFKKEWETTKEQLIKFTKDAVEIAKKGEKELVKLSQKGKIQIDSTTLALKREKLYYLIGKEYVKIKNHSKPTPALQKLIDELKSVDKDQRGLKQKLKTKKKAAKSVS